MRKISEDWTCRVLLALVAIVLLVVGFGVVYLCNPKPEEPSKVKMEVKMNVQSKDIHPPFPEPKKEKKLVVIDDVAARQVIANHIDAFMLKSFKGSCGMNRHDYIKVIAETLVKNAKTKEEAFWLCGMMQSESSFRIGARPGKKTNSSARGVLQVITKYHGDVLNPAKITKHDLETDIEKSVLGGVLVFHKYRYPKVGKVRVRTLEDATKRFRSLSASAEEQRVYRETASSVCKKLTKEHEMEVKKSK